MTTWVDTNVLVALWAGNASARALAMQTLREAGSGGKVVISGCGYAEFLAGPQRTVADVYDFLHDAQVAVAWQTGEDVWRLAADRFSDYVERKRANRGGETKKFLADFLIGAHAVVRGGRLVTFDQRIYRAAYPELELVGPNFEGPVH